MGVNCLVAWGGDSDDNFVGKLKIGWFPCVGCECADDHVVSRAG